MTGAPPTLPPCPAPPLPPPLRRRPVPRPTVPRLLVDLAPWTAEDALEDLLRQARRRGLVDARALTAHLRRPRPGTAAVRGLLDPDRPDLRQELERRFQRFVRRAGLPAPETNAWLPTPLGPLLVDAVWHGPRFVVELDSWRHHGDRDAFETDREREIAAELAGYATRRVTWRMLTRRPDVVRALLARRLG